MKEKHKCERNGRKRHCKWLKSSTWMFGRHTESNSDVMCHTRLESLNSRTDPTQPIVGSLAYKISFNHYYLTQYTMHMHREPYARGTSSVCLPKRWNDARNSTFLSATSSTNTIHICIICQINVLHAYKHSLFMQTFGASWNMIKYIHFHITALEHWTQHTRASKQTNKRSQSERQKCQTDSKRG